MLVDDDPAMGAMYGLGLESIGLRVNVFGDPSAAFLALEEEIPDVMVLDFHLGGIITGVDFLENLRLDPRTADTPAFVLTNHAGDADGHFERALAAGALDWLIKTETSPGKLARRIVATLESGVGAAVREGTAAPYGGAELSLLQDADPW